MTGTAGKVPAHLVVGGRMAATEYFPLPEEVRTWVKMKVETKLAIRTGPGRDRRHNIELY